MLQSTPAESDDGRGHVIVVGRAPEKMREALDVLRSAGFTFNRREALAAIAAHEQLLAVVAGGSVDEQLEADLRAASEPKGAQIIRAYVGHDNPTRHFQDRVLPVLEQLAASAA